WVSFAKTGVPSLDGKAFKPWSAGNNVIVYDVKGGVNDVPGYHDAYTAQLKALRPAARHFTFSIVDLNMDKAKPDFDAAAYK
ncbi:MAG: hypothetical protein HUK26_08025, partial [Duodenibacillus sp.]|nr:hypothetical protein [Duodenibacillus sp.]